MSDREDEQYWADVRAREALERGEQPAQEPARPQRVKRSGLTPTQRAEVATRKAAGESTAALAREYSITPRRVRQSASVPR